MSKTFSLKISPQGQVTLPRDLRHQLGARIGSRVTVVAGDDGSLRVSGKMPIESHFGRLANVWTAGGQDAAVYSRKLRDGMQPKPGRRA